MTGNVARRPPLRVLLACAALACALAALAPTGQAAVKTGPPAIATGRTHVQGASVTLLGTVNPRGAATTYFFQYGPTIAYGKQTTPAALPPGSVSVKVGQPAPGILPGYHYRLVASNSFGAAKPGKDRTFTTSATRKTKLSLVKPQVATVYGGSVTLTGTLTGPGNAARKIVLQESPYPFLTAFATVGLPSATGPTGAFSFHLARLTTSTQYRVSTLDPRPVYSPVLTVDAAYRVTLKVKTSSHRGIVRLYGTVTPAAVGAKVLFQLRKKVRPGHTEKTEERTTRFATRFSTTVKRGTKSFARFSTIVKVRDGGAYQARVLPRKKGPFVSGASATVVLHSAP
jgi:hypothetical protein